MKDLVERFKKRDLRALSRLISLAENQEPEAVSALRDLYVADSPCRVIGFTGMPGAGKSSLIGQLISKIRSEKKTVAVLAVDPSSPHTGGAVLGDRIRLTKHFNDPDVFIRSLGTRGKLGGLSLASHQAVHLIQAFGFDWCLVESVGVGQSEVDIHRLVDMSAVVFPPEWGDSVQGLKSGILEIADLLVVNKKDQPGAERVATELRQSLEITQAQKKEVLLTSLQESATIATLYETVKRWEQDHKSVVGDRRQKRSREVVEGLVRQKVEADVAVAVKALTVKGTNPYETFLKVGIKLQVV